MVVEIVPTILMYLLWMIEAQKEFNMLNKDIFNMNIMQIRWEVEEIIEITEKYGISMTLCCSNNVLVII